LGVRTLRSVFDFLPNWGTENHIGQQNPNNIFIFAKKPKNQVLKNGKVYQESHWTTKLKNRNFFSENNKKPKN